MEEQKKQKSQLLLLEREKKKTLQMLNEEVSPHNKTALKTKYHPTAPEGALQNTTGSPTHPTPSQNSPSPGCLTSASNAAGPSTGGSEALWANEAGHAQQRPKRLLALLTGASGRCLDCKVPGTPEHRLWAPRPAEGLLLLSGSRGLIPT